MIAPMTAASKMIGMRAPVPNHAPNAAYSLKSPKPIPSLPVNSLKLQ